MKRDYTTLDAVVIVWTFGLVSFYMYALAYAQMPQTNISIMTGIISGLVGTVIGGYVAYRWSASQMDKANHTPGTASVSINATAETPKVSEDEKPS